MFRNHFTGMGRLTADPELRTAGESNVVNFTIAVNRVPRKGSESNEADFIDVVAWNVLAENIVKYFKKGDRIGVEGHIQTRSYEDKDGNKRRAVEVVAEGFEFIERKNSSASNESSDDEDMPY